MEDAAKRRQACPICLGPTLSTHFGVISCRACAAFYRRAVIDRKHFHCRKGASCTLFTNIRHACKKCRFDRCVQFGMREEAVLSKKDVAEGCGTSQATVSTVSSPQTSSVPEIIVKLQENYRMLCSVRKATEFALHPNREPCTIEGLEGFCFGTNARMSLFFRAHVPSVVTFISSSFDEFSLLTDDEKWQLLQPFFVFLWWLDGAYRTMKRVDKEMYTRICVMSETTYCDIERIDEWVNDMHLSTDTVAPDVKRFILNRFRPSELRLLAYMTEMQVTEEEYVCLVGILFWNMANVQKTLSENMSKVIEGARRRIFQALDSFYTNLGINWTVRFGELLNLINMLLMECLRARQEIEHLTCLDAFKKEDFFYEMEVCWSQSAVPASPLSPT